MSDEVMASDREVEYAVALPEPFDGVSGTLVITSSIGGSYDSFKAFIIPDAEDQRPIEVAVSSVNRFRDGGTTGMKLNVDHRFLAQSPYKGGKRFVDGKEAVPVSFPKVALG